ncbi:hypothetical protein OKW31_004949 [Paraburkholderia atlantica]
MKRLTSRRRFAILLSTICAVPLAYGFPPAEETGPYQLPMRAPCAASRDTGVRSSVIGAYGGTVVDQLSSGAVVLVKWPNGSPHEAWTGRSHGHGLPVDPAANARHHVDEVMTRTVRTIDASLSVADALAQYFGSTQIHRAYPVVQAGWLVGMADRQMLSAALDGDGRRAVRE